MSNASIAVNYTGPEQITDTYWLRLEQYGVADDTATISDAAAVIDQLFQLDACGEQSEESHDLLWLVTEDGLQILDEELKAAIYGAAEEELDVAICDQESDGSVLVQLAVIRSHPDEVCTLLVAGGEVIERTWTELEVTRYLTVDNATGVTLDYPITGRYSTVWLGNIVTDADTPPAISHTGNTLHWTGATTGTIKATFLTRYELATIKIAGVDGGLGEATVRGFFHGLVDELTPDLPEPAEVDRGLCDGPAATWNKPGGEPTCFELVEVQQRCSCSGEAVGMPTSYERLVTCPDDVTCPTAAACRYQVGTAAESTYIDCPEEADRVSDPEYYQKICCEAPERALPRCKERKLTWSGGAAIDGGVTSIMAQYGPQARIVPLRPPGGCGTWTIEAQVRAEGCCDEGVPLALADDPDHILSRDGMTSVMIDSDTGLRPLYWYGSGVYTVEQRVTEGDSNTVTAHGACSSGTIKVTDGCTTLSVPIVLDLPETEIQGDDIVAAPSSTVVLLATNATGSGEWSSDMLELVSSSPTQAIFATPADFCGTALVVLVDGCGELDSIGVRSTDGKWISDPCTTPYCCDNNEYGGGCMVADGTMLLGEGESYETESPSWTGIRGGTKVEFEVDTCRYGSYGASYDCSPPDRCYTFGSSTYTSFECGENQGSTEHGTCGSITAYINYFIAYLLASGNYDAAYSPYKGCVVGRFWDDEYEEYHYHEWHFSMYGSRFKWVCS